MKSSYNPLPDFPDINRLHNYHSILLLHLISCPSLFNKDKNQLILVYCRSGRRSKLAAEELVKLGYANIKEFGGIIDWPYETV